MRPLYGLYWFTFHWEYNPICGRELFVYANCSVGKVYWCLARSAKFIGGEI